MVTRIAAVMAVLAGRAVAQVPEGWAVRADSGTTAGIKVTPMGPGFRVNTGPAAVLYREADLVPSNFLTEVTFNQTKAPVGLEGFGLVVGGADLQSEARRYVAFMIRTDGTFSVERRNGSAVVSLAQWTPHESIQKTNANGNATNRIGVTAAGRKIRFSVNGKTVYQMDGDVAGIVGLRFEAGLDLYLSAFSARKAGRSG